MVPRRSGMALGVMVGAQTLGASLPHLVNGLGGLDVDVVIVTTSVLTVVRGVVAATTPDGPFPFPRAPFAPRQALAILSDRRIRLASDGYFGHMWGCTRCGRESAPTSPPRSRAAR